MIIPLQAFLTVGVILFAIGLYTVLAQRSAVMIIMGTELMLSAVALNAISFWRFINPSDYSGQIFTIVVVTISTVEMAVGLAIMLLLYRNRKSVATEDYKEMKG
jgi:NAD(P)H-quinone oxidoreductase subunit 4L